MPDQNLQLSSEMTGQAVAAIFARQRKRALVLRSSTSGERIAALRRLEAGILRRRSALYAALAADLHKPEAEVDLSELMPVLAELRHACRQIPAWMSPRRVRPTMAMFGTTAQVRPEPRGVSLIISPWNYPFNLTLGPLVSAIAAGCTAIIKPSELTPFTSAVIAEIIADSFVPDDVALFQGDADVAQSLLALPFDHIFFTGSPAVGKIVMAAAARHLTSVTLELGGKSPVIVDETADLNRAARNIVWGKFSNNGQTCIAPDYAYVHQSRLPAFIEAARAQITTFYGDAARSPAYGRIVNSHHWARVTRLIEDARAGGATIHTGGKGDAANLFISPTLMTGMRPDAQIMQEEIFGPVLPILPYTEIAAPIETINASAKPLALYVFSKDPKRVQRIIGETSSGGACVNTVMAQYLHQNLPFGGVNNSGLGSAHGLYGFRAFSHERAVLTEKYSATALLFPPYTPQVRRMIKMTVRFLT
ncbi:aldehyde dehydrogenase family protein [Acidiphilium sp.]|uniref:aldehyde dehydrogenase family protein n=1 Tax=Acidiphilium sp. TaxID=527 RepID=UPI003CFBDE94